MSCPSPTPSQHDPFESNAVLGASATPIQDLQTPIDPDPLPKSDPDDNSPAEEEEDDEEGEEIDEETRPASSNTDLRIDPPISDLLASPADVTLASPSGRRVGKKRKKGKAKGKGKPNIKTLQAINEKLQFLRSNLNPIPFIPNKILDFFHHEKLLKKLGLWEFVQIDFERTIRVDPVAQLMVNYNAKLRCSKVNGCRIMVNRADLARAFKLPLKKEKEKTHAGGGEVELDWEVSSDESVGFIMVLVSEWMLLHEELWLMPNEVAEWMKLIKGGHPEKVDWAGLLWFMVEKELTQGGQGRLTDCYYASHLQHLIKFQREDAFLLGDEPAKGEVELGIRAKEVEDVDNEKIVEESDAVESNVVGREGDSAVVEGPSTELTLGQDGEKEGEVEEVEPKEVEMMDAESEKCKDSDKEGGGGREGEGEEEGEEQEPWLLNGKNNLGDHFMQRCNSLENTDELGRSENTEELGCSEERKDEDEEMYEEEDGEENEEEARNNFSVFPDDDPLVGNFLQGMETSHMAYSSQEQLRNASSVDARADVQHVDSNPSFFNNSGKRVIEHDYDHAVNDNKRLRTNETWDNKPQDLGMCIEQIVQMAQRARMLADEKEQAAQQSSMNQQILLNEVQKRDNAIEHLHKVRLEETHKKDVEIGRLERELYFMGSVLDGYRKTLKEVKKAFAEYREQAQLPEESIYKDAGPGGLMLTAVEIERRRKKREEEFNTTCLLFEQKFREIGEEWFSKLDGYCDKTNLLETRFFNLKVKAEELIAMHSMRKNPPIEEKMPVDVESLPVLEPKEAVAEEVSEPLPFTEHEDHVPEAADDLPIPQSDEAEIAVHTPPIE